MYSAIISALRTGQTQTALSLAQAHIVQAPQKAEGHYWHAMALQSLGQKPQALAAIDEAIRLAPQRDDFVMTRSIILLGEKDLGEAQAGLMDTLALNPNQLEAYVGLIHIALAQKNIPEAQRLLRLAERVDAEDDNVLVAKGAIAQTEGAIDDALKCFTQASTINPKNPLALSSMGLCYLQKNMPAFAEQALSRALEIAPGNAELWRALCQSQINQERWSEAEQSVSEALVRNPQAVSSLHLRAQLRQRGGDLLGATADVQALFVLRPNDANVLTQLCTLLIEQQHTVQAKEVLDQALIREPGNDGFWQLRAGFEASMTGDSGALLQQWLVARPGSAMAHEALAIYHEARGELAAAQQWVDRALALSEQLPMAQFIKLRQEIRDTPEAALQRIERLAEIATNPEAQRMVLAWMGIIHDRLGQFERAAQAFAQMAQYVAPGKMLPNLYPAEQVPEGAASGHFVWAPVGARVERIFNVLHPVLGANFLADRNQPSPARDDGFGPFRAEPGTPEAGSATRWRAGVEALGLSPEQVVDWLPQWDAYTAAALEGGPLVALLLDPRDALINWMVFGSAQGYVFLPRIDQSARWLAYVFQAVADSLEQNPQARAIKIDGMSEHAQEIGLQLQQVLNTELTPDIQTLAKPILSLGGMDNQFPAGHWRHYKTYFAEAFAHLTPLAVRLGYPEQ